MVAQPLSHPHCLDFRSYGLLRPFVTLENRRRDNLESNLRAVGEKREERNVFRGKGGRRISLLLLLVWYVVAVLSTIANI